MSCVELLPAHLWICPECGRDNFERCIVPELSQQQIDEYRERFQMDNLTQGMVLSAPLRVICPDCQKTFDTEFFEQKGY